MTERRRQILVAGVGNAWMSDDGFGGHVASALLASASCPTASPCSTSARGGLDLAYEVMRGYDALRAGRRRAARAASPGRCT